MTNGPDDGTSTELTVTTAASVFEGMISHDETPDSPETPPPEQAEEPAEATEVEEPTEQAPDDGESDEESAEDTPSEEDPEAEAEPESEPEPRVFKVKVDGEEVEVPEEELIKGYSRTADYTRKTQTLANERKAFEAEAAAVREERQKYAATLTQLEQYLSSVTEEKVDWDKLREEDPVEFSARYVDYTRQKEAREQVQRERERAQQLVEQDNRVKLAEHIQAERARLLEAFPTWKDESVAAKERAELFAFANDMGFTEEDVAGVVDHRIVVLLRKAMLHEKAQKSRPLAQKKIESVKAATPGPKAPSKAEVSNVTRAKQRLAKTGRAADAAALFESMLDD